MTAPTTTRILPGTVHAKRRKLAIAAGTWQPFVPADAAIKHVEELRRRGASVRAIADAAHVSLATLARLAYPDTVAAPLQWGIRPATARAVLGVTLHDLPDYAWIPNVGTRRRIEALAALGWRPQDLADRFGISAQAVRHWRSNPSTSLRVYRTVVGLYDELSMTRGPSRITARRAAASGYAPPLAWDDETIDDPAATPATAPRARMRDDVDQTVIDLVLAGHEVGTTIAERERLVPVLAARGLTDREIAKLCRTTDNTVFRIRGRLGVESRWAA